MEVRAVIMAGGSGTRFWPLSRRRSPKQFLPIISERTMIEETVERLLPLISINHILTVANAEQSRTIGELFPELPRENILVEPRGKNTAASLILATARLYLEDPQIVIAALPADHLILDKARFRRKLEAAAMVASGGHSLITFGIPPTYPATGYGYIHFSEKGPQIFLEEAFFKVEEFKEKPGLEEAQRFLEEGRYYWNSGMFLWRADTFAQNLQKYAPTFYPFWRRMVAALKEGKEEEIIELFEEIPSLSIDYALMEKARDVLVCQGDFGWSDVGSWSSLFHLWPKSSCGNFIKGELVSLDSSNCLIYNPQKLTAMIGVEDLIVVETEDTLLICHKTKDQKVKELLEVIQKKGKNEYL